MPPILTVFFEDDVICGQKIAKGRHDSDGNTLIGADIYVSLDGVVVEINVSGIKISSVFLENNK